MRIKDFSVAIGFDGSGRAKCLIVANEGLPDGGMRALTASRAYLKGADLHFDAPAGTLILEGVSENVREVLQQRLPVVVLDKDHDLERTVDVVAEPADEPGPASSDLSLPPGFFG